MVIGVLTKGPLEANKLGHVIECQHTSKQYKTSEKVNATNTESIVTRQTDSYVFGILKPNVDPQDLYVQKKVLRNFLTNETELIYKGPDSYYRNSTYPLYATHTSSLEAGPVYTLPPKRPINEHSYVKANHSEIAYLDYEWERSKIHITCIGIIELNFINNQGKYTTRKVECPTGIFAITNPPAALEINHLQPAHRPPKSINYRQLNYDSEKTLTFDIEDSTNFRVPKKEHVSEPQTSTTTDILSNVSKPFVNLWDTVTGTASSLLNDLFG